ncbi:hypothetical protein ACFQ0O_32555 [Saccharopolyspora spinosporotrichia]|nr:hypothetical protein N599_19965 [Saccharopolyspora erythraea D]
MARAVAEAMDVVEEADQARGAAEVVNRARSAGRGPWWWRSTA